MTDNTELYFARLTAAPKKCAAPAGDRAELKKWQKRARPILRRILAISGKAETAVPELLGREELSDHVRELWRIQTEPDVFMPFYLLIPKGKGPFPAAIAVHGHGFGAKDGVAGVWENPLIRESAREYNAGFGLELVRKGFLTAVPDVRGFGSRREKGHTGDACVLENSCPELMHLATGLGKTLPGMFVTDLIRLADFLTENPNAVRGKISCVGLSGGGFQTLLFAALDKRVKNCVVSGYFYGAKRALYDMPQCACNYAPGLWQHFDMRDLAGLIAPRGLFVETGEKDPLNGGLDNALAEGNAARDLYDRMGVPEKFRQEVYEGGHRFYGVHSLDWLTGENLTEEHR